MSRAARGSTLEPRVIMLAVAATLLIGASAGRAAPRATLTGVWNVTIETERGAMQTSWDLVQHDDGTLTGTVESRRGRSDVEDGYAKGDTFRFVVHRKFQGQSFEIRYSGTFAEDSLEGTLTAGEDGRFTANFTGERGGPPR